MLHISAVVIVTFYAYISLRRPPSLPSPFLLSPTQPPTLPTRPLTPYTCQEKPPSPKFARHHHCRPCRTREMVARFAHVGLLSRLVFVPDFLTRCRRDLMSINIDRSISWLAACVPTEANIRSPRALHQRPMPVSQDTLISCAVTRSLHAHQHDLDREGWKTEMSNGKRKEEQ